MANIIVVDDSQFMRLILKEIITGMGHTVIAEAEDGYEAILKYSELHPDLVTMDINMPRMSGVSALKEIIKIDPSAKIVICSALGQQSMITEAIRAGAKDFVVKPIQESRVKEAIHKIITDQ
ncbi:response regulator [Paenibacillus crassostreae]|uniref:Two-component system response regulator n=1 Tax=Paenibacillus crassostreae TaxID=1763538 RepID=A0A167B5J2_9BACL|nr:response regulator [Paenibacillus crassostreae]AOZ93150.1 two-component system response regulator [Paenibacillus crassostreae]OAB71760.1 two-component system response regulator [Paenibacillus crassostreae]